MQKTIAFHHDKDIDMLKLDFTSPNLANKCLYKNTDAKVNPFSEGDKDLQEKTRDDVAGCLSVMFTRKAVVDETFFSKINKLLQITCWG